MLAQSDSIKRRALQYQNITRIQFFANKQRMRATQKWTATRLLRNTVHISVSQKKGHDQILENHSLWFAKNCISQAPSCVFVNSWVATNQMQRITFLNQLGVPSPIFGLGFNWHVATPLAIVFHIRDCVVDLDKQILF